MTRAGHLLRRRRYFSLLEQLRYRLPMDVAEIHVFPRCGAGEAYPVCPGCRMTMEREYMAFCSRCGQRLDWRRYAHARIVYVEPEGHLVRLEDSVCTR